MRSTGTGIAAGCGIVLFGLTVVLLVVALLPVTAVDSLERLVFVGSAAGIPYSFGVLVGVSSVYHASRRRRFLFASGLAALLALACVYLTSGSPSLFSASAKSVADYVVASVLAVWVFLPLVGLFFGALAVSVGKSPAAGDALLDDHAA